MNATLSGKTKLFALISLVMLMLLSLPLYAQTFYGSIVGTVTDASGAVVPGATVTVTDVGTNEVRSMKSDAAGNYNFVNLVPANYKVDVEANTFKHFVHQQFALLVGSTLRIDVTLQVGAASETVTVTSQAPLLQTESGSLTSQVTGNTVQQMPLNGRNTMNLIALVAGVVPQGSSMGDTGINQTNSNTQLQGWGNYQISGGMAGQSAEYVDGAPVNNIAGNFVSLVPTQDAIQEFNVTTNNVSADFGRFAGGVVNMTTKSGTNAFHGSAYEYLRNSFFNANDWFFKKSELAASKANKPGKWNQNQYGVVVNGPIKRDKAFFLFTWEGFKSRLAPASPTTVPTTGTLGLQSGVFSDKITDPLASSTRQCISTTANPGYYTVLQSCWDPAARVMKNFYDAPNALSAVGYNYTIATVFGDNQNQYNARVDYNVSDKQRIFGRFTDWNLSDSTLNEFPDNKYNLGNVYLIMPASTQVVLGDTYTLNPTSILDVRISWLRSHLHNVSPSGLQNIDESQFGGTWGTLGSEMMVHEYPAMVFSGQHAAFYNAWDTGGIKQQYFYDDAISASLTKIVGKHSFKLGGEARKMIYESWGGGSANLNSGSFTFTGQYTGDDWADFLLGYVQSGSIGVVARVAGFNYYQGYYLQDNWTLTRKLTLNLGLRWELPGSIAESNDKQTVLLPNATDPYTGVRGTLSLVKSPLYGPRTIEKVKLYLLAPRLGFAYRLDNNTAIRGGYAVNYLPPDLNWGMMPLNSPVNAAPANTFSSPQVMVPGTTYPTLSAPFQNLVQPIGRSNPAFMENNLFTSVMSPIPTEPSAYMQQWNLSASRQFKGDLMVQLGYAGSKGTHLPTGYFFGGVGFAANDQDELNQQYWSLGAALDAKANYVTITTPIGGYSKSVSLGQSLRPYPFYQNLGDVSPSWGASTYHAGIVTVEKRFKSGGILTGNYIWSKMISDTDSLQGKLETKASASTRTTGEGVYQDFNNHKGERSILSFNVPSRLVVSYVLPLPFGQGQRYLNSTNGIVGRIISGWNVDGITTFQSGLPLPLQEAKGNSLTNNYGAGQLRPDYDSTATNCNGNKKVGGSTRQRIGQWFNTACFEAPGTKAGTVGYALGSEPRVDSTLRAEGQDSWDLSAVKSTKVTEKTALEFRAEFFNVFNRVQFAPPVIQRGASNFGDIISDANLPRLVQFALRLNF